MTQNSERNLSRFLDTALKGSAKTSGSEIALPLHDILRHLALQPTSGKQLFPSTWTHLRVRGPLEADTEVSQSLNANYQLQHNAHAVFDTLSKKWRIDAHGDPSLVRILGVIASKKHGARVIQLPNHTHKVVAGIINGETLLSSFKPPVLSQDGKKVTLTPIENTPFPFFAIVPEYKARSGKSPQKVETHAEFKHLEYVLHSGNKGEGKGDRAQLTWTDSPRKTLTVVNGSDVEDLSQYKSILQTLRYDFNDQHPNESNDAKRQNLEKRLLLLEHEIDGLLKRKINFTSKDASGTRFLDYTTLLNQKENEIITLHKKIDNLQSRLKAKNSEENHLKDQITRLNEVVKAINNPHITREDIDNLLLNHIETVNLHKQTQKLKSKTAASHSLLKTHLEDLKLKGVKVEHEDKLRTLIDDNKDVDVKLKDGVVHLVQTKDRVIETNIQDAKTKELVKQMGLEIYRIYSRYPKIREQASPQFVELLNKEVINVVDADGLSKITEIVRYVPSLVKVENVYNINNDKQRKLEFHLKVLLKSLLIEFEKIKKKAGVTPQIDEQVIKLIHDQIGDSVSTDDILKVFQVNQKIVEVPKIVEKVVERVIEVPTIMPVEKIVEKIVYNTKIEQVQKIIHVPVEVVKYVDRIVEKIVEVEKIRQKVVEVPKIMEKIVERRVEVPKIVEVEIIREKIIQKEIPVIVERIVNQPVQQIKEVEVIKHETVVVKEVQERIKQVQKIVQKIVQRIVEKPVIIEVQKIVQKLVNTVSYKPARQVVNYVEHVPQIVERIVEKVIPVIQTVQKIKQVTKIVEKIVECRVEVPRVRQVKVIEQKIVFQDRVKEVERIVQKIVPLIKEVVKIVENRVEVPVIQEKIVRVKEVVEKVVAEKYETVKIVQVQKIVEKLVQVIKIVEVQRPIVKYITVEKPVKVIVEKIIQVPRVVQKIKEVRVPVDKIIQKLVQVPKVVQVQKIVEKIVVVPRIVEKIVEVPQIVQRIVDRIVEVIKTQEIIKEVHVPIIQEKVVQVQVIKNIQVPFYKEVQVIKEKIVPAIQDKQVIKQVDVNHEKVVEARVEVPKQIVKEKIVTQTIEIEKIVQVEKPIVIPFQVPVPCDKVVQKLVIVEKEVQKIKQVPQYYQRIVGVMIEVPIVKEITKIEQQPVIHEKMKQIEKIVPYITQKVNEVQVVKEKIVQVPQINQKIKEVAAYQDKIVQVIHEVAKIYEIQKVVEKPVEVPRFIEITAKDPVIINNNKIVERLVDKIVHTNTVEQKIVQVPTIKEKIVTVQKLVQQIKEIHVNKDRIVEKEKLINKTNVENKIETKYQTVDRIQEKLVPVSGSSERIVEVPHLMEKVVERIVLMPQVHQVTQHIYDIHEQEHPGVAVDVQFSEHEVKYNKLVKDFKKDSSSLITELRALKKSHPELSQKLQALEKNASEFDQINTFPRVVQTTKQKVVNRDVAVPVLVSNTSTTYNVKNQAFYLILIEKLIKQLKNAQKKTSYAIEDEEIKLLFLNAAGKNDDKKIKDKLQKFKNSAEGQKYSQLKADQSLLGGILYDKFYLASQIQTSKLQTERYRKIAEQRLGLLHKFKQTNDLLHQRLVGLEDRVKGLKKDGCLSKDSLQKLVGIEKEIRQIDELLFTDIKNIKISQPIQTVSKGGNNDDANYRLQSSKIRELQSEIELLRKEYVDKVRSQGNPNDSADKDRVIDNLRRTIIQLIDNKGTKTTLGDDERGATVSSLDKIGDRSPKKPAKNNETSIIRYLSGNSPTKQRPINFNYQQPRTIVIPNLIDPNNVLALPGQISRVSYVDQNGAVVNSFNQSGQVQGAVGPEGSYRATYMYKSQAKESGEGEHKVEKIITEIRTNQTVDWISRSRVVDKEIKIDSPSKDNPLARISISPKKEDRTPPKQ